jgi:hypothetical protein
MQRNVCRSLAKSSRAALVVLVGVAMLACACANVAPHERAKLAHPTMTTDDLAGPAEEHVRAVQEGAIGGGTSAGGGCGCN